MLRVEIKKKKNQKKQKSKENEPNTKQLQNKGHHRIFKGLA